MTGATEQLDTILAQYDLALEKIGLVVPLDRNSRFHAYRRIIARNVGLDSKETGKRDDTERLFNSLIEAHDVLEIASLPLLYLSAPGITKRLRVAVNGRPFRANYGYHDHDPNRNAAFELCAAAYLNSHGMLADPPLGGADVMLLDGALVRPVECKRIASIKKIGDNIHKANKQLTARVSAGNPPGIIMADVSRVLNPSLRPLRSSSADGLSEHAGSQFTYLMDTYVESMRKPENVSPASLGILVRYVEGGFAGSNASIRRYKEWGIAQLHKDDSTEAAMFMDIVRRLGDERIVARVQIAPKNYLAKFIHKEVGGQSKNPMAILDKATCLGEFYARQGLFEGANCASGVHNSTAEGSVAIELRFGY